ncbi:Transposase and inactivated derivatives, partial [Lactococcus garvieae]
MNAKNIFKMEMYKNIMDKTYMIVLAVFISLSLLLNFSWLAVWSYTIKVDRKLCVIICLLRHKKERTFMSGFKRYDEDFKQSLVNLYQTGKTQTELCKDYGVSSSALAKWIKQYSQVRLEDNTVLTAKQIQELQKRNAQLEEENLILKKA